MTPQASATSIALDSYQFGFQHPHSNSSGTGKTTFDDLVVSLPLNANSPLLFQVLVKGAHYDRVGLIQRDASGHPVAQWTLGTVFVTTDEIDGKGSNTPTETLHFVFAAITEGTSAATASWDQTTNTDDNHLPPARSVALSPLPEPATPNITLELLQPDGTSSAVTIALNSYLFGFHDTVTGTTTGTRNHITFDDLVVGLALNGNSPLLFQTLTSASQYGRAVLTQRNSAGQPVAEWVLGTVFLTVDDVNGSIGNKATETLHVYFSAITEVSNIATASWNQVTNNDIDVPQPPPGVTLFPLGVLTPAVSVSASGGVYGDGSIGVTSATVAAGNTTLATLGNASLTFTYYVGSTVSGSGFTTTPKNVGTYTVVAHYTSSDANYTDADSFPATFTITPTTLHIRADAKTKIIWVSRSPVDLHHFYG